MRGRRWLVVLVFALIATVVWLESADERSSKSATSRVSGSEPDVTMSGATISEFDATGTLEYRLVATTIRHFESDDSTHLESPALEMFRAPQPPWLARAKSGDIRYRTDAAGKREEVVALREDVQLEQRQADRFTKLSTSAVDVFPERRFAETDQAVMIDSNAGRTNAIGLSGDLNADLLKLNSNARQRVDTTILPNQFKNAIARPRS